MEQGAGLGLDGDMLTVTARNDIYIRYLNDNKSVIAELASEHLGRAIRVELSTNGASIAASSRPTMPLPGNGGNARGAAGATVVAPAVQAIAAEPAPRKAPPSKPIESIRETAPVSPAAEARAPGDAEERQAVLADPAVRRVFDTLDARLVELKMPNSAEAAAKELK